MWEDQFTRAIEIRRFIEGHYDKNHNWIPGSAQIVATADTADIQPKSGHERATELQTKYESDYVMFVQADDIEFNGNLPEDEQRILQGDDVIETSGQQRKFKVAFEGNWGTHYESDLKLEKGG